MDLSILGNGTKDKGVEEESNTGLMEAFMKAIEIIIWQMGKED